jgi:hypothetical protein
MFTSILTKFILHFSDVYPNFYEFWMFKRISRIFKRNN